MHQTKTRNEQFLHNKQTDFCNFGNLSWNWFWKPLMKTNSAAFLSYYLVLIWTKHCKAIGFPQKDDNLYFGARLKQLNTINFDSRSHGNSMQLAKHPKTLFNLSEICSVCGVHLTWVPLVHCLVSHTDRSQIFAVKKRPTLPSIPSHPRAC